MSIKHILLAALALALSAPAFAVDFTVSGQGLPASATSPTSDQGKALTTTTLVKVVVIKNTSGSSQTFTVNDCQGTPFYLFKSDAIPAGTTVVANLGPGISFAGCVQWSASATSVMGSISGSQ